MRLERPVSLDLRAIADGVVRNNMGVGGIEVRVRGTLAAGKAVLQDTGQELAVQGGPASATGPWLWFDAKEYGLGMVDHVTWVRDTPLPELQ